jgi:hypothetical protein
MESTPELTHPIPETVSAREELLDRPSPQPERREAPPPPARPHRPASPASVQEAIEEVNQISKSLREALDLMDEVLETLELAERQKDADEQEIESLRRALRQMGRPREGGPQPHRGHSSEQR